MCTGLLTPKTGQRGWNETDKKSHWQSHDCPGTHPSLNLATARAPRDSRCSFTLGRGLQRPRREKGCEAQRGLRPGVGGNITAAKTGSTSEALRVANCSWSNTARDQTPTEYPHQPLLLQHCSPLGPGCRFWEQGEHTRE